MSHRDDGTPYAISIPLPDEDWAKVEHLFREDSKQRGGRPKANPRAILNAILWITSHHESWNHLPATFPPIQTCYIRSLKWRKSGQLGEAFALLGFAPERHGQHP
jgi:transposase